MFSYLTLYTSVNIDSNVGSEAGTSIQKESCQEETHPFSPTDDVVDCGGAPVEPNCAVTAAPGRKKDTRDRPIIRQSPRSSLGHSVHESLPYLKMWLHVQKAQEQKRRSYSEGTVPPERILLRRFPIPAAMFPASHSLMRCSLPLRQDSCPIGCPGQHLLFSLLLILCIMSWNQSRMIPVFLTISIAKLEG